MPSQMRQFYLGKDLDKRKSGDYTPVDLVNVSQDDAIARLAA